MPIDRRRFLRSGAVGVAGVAVAGATTGCAPASFTMNESATRFAHGVASGDPLADRVILWTRITPTRDERGAAVPTRWWIGEHADGRAPVAEGVAVAEPARDYTVKVDAEGLVPGVSYHYGFEAGGERSTTGRTRTLPPTGVARVRLAFLSCSNYPAGFFNGYGHLARRDDLDAVLHLGDYLYEYGHAEYGDGTALGRIPAPLGETITLDDYRWRHASYKADPDLQAAHGRHPWITVWDDHETANNSHTTGAQNHDPETEGRWRDRMLAAIRAYYEWMPIRELPTGLFRRFRFGDLLDLVMLDTRLQRDAQVARRDDAGANDPDRSLLGEDQTGWLLDALSQSAQDGIRWRVIGQQVVVSPSAVSPAGFNPDAWSGYRESRRQVLGHLLDEGIRDVVFLSGDVHSSWVFEVPHDDGTPRCALEFVCPAISSPPIGRSRSIDEETRARIAQVEHLAWFDIDHNGYAVVELTPEAARVEYLRSAPVEARSPEAREVAVFEAAAGTHRVVRVDPADGDARG
ncbi:MAG: alkaline phosphatase D family protein [Myxococcota bacterium]